MAKSAFRDCLHHPVSMNSLRKSDKIGLNFLVTLNSFLMETHEAGDKNTSVKAFALHTADPGLFTSAAHSTPGPASGDP